ncbi:hypothetical protein BJ170DRAFT_633741 [Xylariales sp. AK1849]|nr:hypothetical protein BJ170DRAFT_633741 [Xylariales sp. AK1849]
MGQPTPLTEHYNNLLQTHQTFSSRAITLTNAFLGTTMADLTSTSEVTVHGFWTRYSSWTARVILVLEYFKIPYKAQYYNIYGHAEQPPPDRLKGRLYPMLQPDPNDPDFIIDESLAICEFLAETHPELALWPKDVKLRALARAAAAQMHAGFGEVRNTYHSNFTAKYTGKIPVSEAAAKEIRKMIGVWNGARAQTKQRLQSLGEEDEGFLFGKFTIADAFFWPVLWRFRSYQLPLDSITRDGLDWMATMWNHPVMVALAQDCFEQRKNPRTSTARYEDIFADNPEIQYGQFDGDWKFSP